MYNSLITNFNPVIMFQLNYFHVYTVYPVINDHQLFIVDFSSAFIIEVNSGTSYLLLRCKTLIQLDHSKYLFCKDFLKLCDICRHSVNNPFHTSNLDFIRKVTEPHLKSFDEYTRYLIK